MILAPNLLRAQPIHRAYEGRVVLAGHDLFGALRSFLVVVHQLDIPPFWRPCSLGQCGGQAYVLT